jgi:hypothetical protein
MYPIKKIAVNRSTARNARAADAIPYVVTCGLYRFAVYRDSRIRKYESLLLPASSIPPVDPNSDATRASRN